MKRKFILGCVLCVFILLLVGCDDWDLLETDDSRADIAYGDIYDTYAVWAELVISSPLQAMPELDNAVSMYMVQVDMNERTATVAIRNDSSYLLMTGADFVINFFDGTHWLNVPWHGGFPTPFISEGIGIRPADTIELIKNLNLFEPLRPGLYRIRKNVFIDGAGIGYLHEITAEFYWE